jgi:nucleoside-diphosphate-sugar epimerase
MSTLITGASGFVGLHLAERLLAQGESVVGLSATPVPVDIAARFAALPGRYTDVVGDVRDAALLDATLAAHRVERVAHLAAITASSAREMTAAATVLDVNLVGLATTIKACADAGVRRFLYASSIAVFGGVSPDGSLVDEDAPHAGATLYAITKSAGEAITARLAGLHGMDYVIGRLGRVFGPYEYATGVRDTLSQVYQATMLARERQPFCFARPCVKNWNYGPDVAASLEILLTAPDHRHAVYNLGTPHAWSLAAWCERLAARLPGMHFTVGPAPAGACEIDLGGARDAGLLSWQRFTGEFAPPPPRGIDAAFDHYLDFLDTHAVSDPTTEHG